MLSLKCVWCVYLNFLLFQVLKLFFFDKSLSLQQLCTRTFFFLNMYFALDFACSSEWKYFKIRLNCNEKMIYNKSKEIFLLFFFFNDDDNYNDKDAVTPTLKKLIWICGFNFLLFVFLCFMFFKKKNTIKLYLYCTK